MGFSLHADCNGITTGTKTAESSKNGALINPVEKLDAGLRSLDHCTLSHYNCSMRDSHYYRQEQAASMEIYPSTEAAAPRTMGNTLSGCDAKPDALASSRLVLFHYG